MSQFLKCAAILLLGTSALVVADEPKRSSRFVRHWVYTHPGFDLRNDEGCQQLIDLITRAEKAGYNGVCVTTGPLELLQVRQPDAYYKNIERVRATAESLKIELIPTAMRMNGYANGVLSNNPNLAPGVPVKDCVMVVRTGQAVVANGGNLLSDGDLEAFTVPNRPDGWDWLDLPGSVSFQDREVVRNGRSSLRFEHFETASQHGNCRIFKKLSLKPWHQYHLRFWMKTQDVKRPESIRVMVQGNVDAQKSFTAWTRTPKS